MLWFKVVADFGRFSFNIIESHVCNLAGLEPWKHGSLGNVFEEQHYAQNNLSCRCQMIEIWLLFHTVGSLEESCISGSQTLEGLFHPSYVGWVGNRPCQDERYNLFIGMH